MVPTEDRITESELQEERDLLLAMVWPAFERPVNDRPVAMIADPVMGSLLASLPRKDSEIV